MSERSDYGQRRSFITYLDMAEVKPAPPQAKLFKILCCPLNTKTGYCIVESLFKPYVDNETDMNVIVGSLTPDAGNAVGDGDSDIHKAVRKVINVQ